jgi:DNA-directed RNA polymerase specialized sigma24 family protein
MEKSFGVKLAFRADPNYHIENFKIINAVTGRGVPLAVRSLPERCRQVFLLRKIQNLSQREIASRLSISENTVESLVAKGARRCADYLRARGVGPRSDDGT